ncbi:MAG: O-methyltransferase, partial [Erysipelotrichaceae bacterium]|nr:O-methyltransferase [Erysipelotrichaceae bacterium]
MIDEIKKEALEKGVPIIKDEGLAFLLNYIEEHGCRQILELGTAVGYSSMEMAGLSKDIHIDTIEKNKEMYEQAVANIRNSGLEDQISVFFMPIEEFETDRKYDLIFVDAAKAQYGKYMEKFLDNLNEDGAMIFDNMIFHGLIYEVEKISSRNLRNLVKKIIKFRELVQNDKRFDIIKFDDIGDGILVLTRRKSG